MSKILKAHLALFAVNSIYGANHVIAKGVMPAYLTPNVFIALRILGSAILFWIIKSFYIKEKIERKDLFLIASCAFFGVAVNQLFFFHGLNLSSSINAGIIMTLNPIMVFILAYFILKEKLSLLKAVGVAIGALGALLLTLNAGKSTGDSFLGDVFLIINCLSYAIYLILVKPLMSKYSPLTVITYIFTFGAFFVFAFPPTIQDLLVADFARIPTDIWLKIGYVILFVTFLAYLLMVYALSIVSATVSSSYIYLQPVMVIFFAYIFSALNISEDYTDTITFQKLGNMLLIFLGVFMVAKAKINTNKTSKIQP